MVLNNFQKPIKVMATNITTPPTPQGGLFILLQGDALRGSDLLFNYIGSTSNAHLTTIKEYLGKYLFLFNTLTKQLCNEVLYL